MRQVLEHDREHGTDFHARAKAGELSVLAAHADMKRDADIRARHAADKRAADERAAAEKAAADERARAAEARVAELEREREEREESERKAAEEEEREKEERAPKQLRERITGIDEDAPDPEPLGPYVQRR